MSFCDPLSLLMTTVELPTRSKKLSSKESLPWVRKKRQSVLRVTNMALQHASFAVCSSCSKQFKVPMSALTRTKDAQTNLQQQFDLHECKNHMAG
jgi:hypothetical protein